MAKQSNGFDALVPPEMAVRAELIGVSKAKNAPVVTFLLAILAGGFIAMGAVFSTTVTTGAAAAGIPYGIVRAIAGLAFCLGLIMVVAGGAELFTGNHLIVMAWSSKKVSTPALLRNWAIVFAGNFVGSVLTAVGIFAGGHHLFGKGAVGANALAIASSKCSLDFFQAFALGVLCNALVCMAVWLTLSARSTTDRLLSVLFPITAFVAAGFEHCVANMYFVPIGLLIKEFAGDDFWKEIGSSPDKYPSLDLVRFFTHNLLPVTLGNIVGGAGMVGGVYWLIYSHRREPETPDTSLEAD